MKNFIVLFSIVAVNSAIRVPNDWDQLYPAKVTVRTYKDVRPRRTDQSNNRFITNIQPELNSRGWSPALPKRSIKYGQKYNKKPIQPYTKKRKRFNKPFNKFTSENYKETVPYITYKNPHNAPNPTLFMPNRPLNIFSNVYPQVQNRPKQKIPVTYTLDPFISKPESNFVPSIQLQNYYSNNINSYEPNEKIVNYFEAVKNENFIPSKIYPGDTQTKSNNQNNYYNENSPSKENNQFYKKYEPKNRPTNSLEENNLKYYNHLYKNYRDDSKFEPENDNKYYIKEEIPKFERESQDQAPPSSHEVPQEIPTRPIYPGQGLWAKPGLTHKPFISQQTYDTLKEDEVKPDGYNTFMEGKQLFKATGDDLSQRFRSFPDQHNLASFIQQKPIELNKTENEEINNENISEEESNEEDEFVPTRLYAQVRASEDTEYIPSDEADDGKLREAIKESKIHTVYTEEGYEDSAYDHAGHEKEAENDEGFEDLQRQKLEKKENRVPEAKLNLHLPKLQRTKFSYGDELLSDEEINRIKEEQLGIGDTEAAGTQFYEPPIDNNEEEDEDIENESITTESYQKPKKNNNNYISTKETKTMTTKEKNDGDTETEISSNVKIILQPNNSTKSQKYTKLYPKVYKTIRRKKPHTDNVENKPLNFSGIFIEEVLPTTNIPFTKLPSTEYQDLPEEIPITTLPTTAIPKPIKPKNKSIAEEALEDITKEFLKVNKKRVKRFANDFSDLRIENDFVPKISHQFGKVPDLKYIKYPYYKNYQKAGLNIDSPLRYSQNTNQIPNKTGNKMVFYEEADKAIPCPDIEANLNPIPERVLHAEKEKVKENSEEIDEQNEETDIEDTTSSREKREVGKESKSPRLSGLGDQIDCLKARYFGENPLDSPFFDEVTVGTIQPIFKELIRSKYEEENDADNEINKPIKNNNVDEDKKLRNVMTQPNTDNNTKNTNDTTDITKIPTISLLTTPGYTIDLKPKHIYDQIELLEYLPNQEVVSNNTSTNDVRKVVSTNLRQNKAIDDDNIAYESSDDNPALPEAEELIRRRKIRRKRPPFQIFDVNKFLPTTPSLGFQPVTQFPVSVNGQQKPGSLQIFDVNKFIPTRPPIFQEIVTSSTVLPKYKVLSEVFYKDDIKPNEQLNVFTDILNNIKNSSHEHPPPDASIDPSEPVSVTLNTKTEFDNSKKRHIPVYYQDSYLKAYGDQEIDPNYSNPVPTTTTTTITPTTYRGRIRHKVRNPSLPVTNNLVNKKEFEQKLKLYIALQEAKKKQKYNSVHNNIDYDHIIPVNEDTNDYVDKSIKVVGLMPPGTNYFKTIYHPKRDNSLQIATPNLINRKINKFIVVGMRPPPAQRVFVYTDYLNNNHLSKKISLQRGKRSTGRGSYASLSRNRELESESEDTTPSDNDDDYVPHRPKNYFYDEKTGKIIYLTTKKPKEIEEEDVEYEEIIEEPPATTSKPKQDPIFATATPPPEGKGYIDFVLKLKQNPNYKYIPDPTTTEKSVEEKTTLKPQSTTPPEFLNILSKVRQNNQYKLIEDKTEKKDKKTTTEAPEELVDSEEEEEDDDVIRGQIKNSPGGLSYDPNEHFGIFDVTDFIPKIKNYIPKTSYDTSKYQTINRPTTKSTTVEEDESESEETIDRRYHHTTQEPTTQTAVITAEPNHNLDSLNEATLTKQEEIPIKLQRRRLTTTTSTSTSTTISPKVKTTQKPTIKPTFPRRRRPTTLRSTRATTSKPTIIRPSPTSSISVSHEEKVRRVFRRRPATKGTTTTKYLDEQDDDTVKVLRRRSGTAQQTSTEAPTTHKANSFVETFKKFHRNKKHGGSYKKDDSSAEQSRQPKKVEKPVEEVGNVIVDKDVEIIGDYDKAKRHGGNYRRVEENKEQDVEKEEPLQDYDYNDKAEDNTKASDKKSLRISLLPKEEEDEENIETYVPLPERTNNKVAVNKKKSIKKSRGKYVTEPTLQRLTDVVPNPEAFYSDPTLPRSVNLLAVSSEPSSAELTDILSSTDSGEISIRRDENEKDVYILDTVTKKPFIIKDPSKRLYFYAPI